MTLHGPAELDLSPAEISSRKWDAVLSLLWKRSRFVSFFYQGIQFLPDTATLTLTLTVSRFRRVLRYHPGFVTRLDTEHLIGLLVHEFLHVALNHSHRSVPGKNTYLQNIAQDMVVNAYMIRRSGSFFSRRGVLERDIPKLQLPPGLPVIPDDFYIETGHTDPTWEAVYTWLDTRGPADMSAFTDAAKTQLEQPPQVNNPFNAAMENPDPEPSERTEWGFQMDDAGLIFYQDEGQVLPTGMHTFHDASAERSLTASFRRIIEQGRREKTFADERVFQAVDGLISGIQRPQQLRWKRQIRTTIDRYSTADRWRFTPARPNRRFLDSGIYAAGRVLDFKKQVIVAVDVSSSMVGRPETLQRAFGVVEDLLDQYTVHLLCVDETVFVPKKGLSGFTASPESRRPYTYHRGDWQAIRTGSSGTTFFAPLFNDWLKGVNEAVLVVTDGHIYDLNRLTPYRKTVWLVTSRPDTPFSPGFGNIYYLDDDEMTGWWRP
ncbi:MAG: hypothetical protein CSA22_01765 [Deltaproteobacteria bacterium]|nr:MAG: hypothetical protein CSA22_01765 [Deltaproteobacteria bacterium]